jgi:hypothetical protein
MTIARGGGGTRPAAFMIAALLTVAVLVSACGGPAPAPTGTPDPTQPPAGATPKATPWPGSVVEGVMHLGAADAEIWKAGADFARAVDQQDPKAMWGAADGMVKLLEAHLDNVERIEGYPHTRPLADAYRTAFPIMLEGATTVRDSIVAGDAEGIADGTRRLVEGIRAYGEVRVALGPYVEESIRMQRLLVR